MIIYESQIYVQYGFVLGIFLLNFQYLKHTPTLTFQYQTTVL